LERDKLELPRQKDMQTRRRFAQPKIGLGTRDCEGAQSNWIPIVTLSGLVGTAVNATFAGREE